jgi:mitochondrial GTPase 1
MAATQFGRRVGRIVKERIERRKSSVIREGLWNDPFMVASTRAIAERIPLVDLIVHVTDARIPFSSQCHLLTQTSDNHIIALNKADLASRSTLQVRYFSSFTVHKLFEKIAYMSGNNLTLLYLA